MSSEPTPLRLATVSPEGLILEFESQVYRLSAVKKAAYKFGDRFHAQVSLGDGSTIRVLLQAKSPLESPDHVAGEFCNEVLDQELREQVAEETRPIRDLLLAQAFSATSLIDPHGDEGDFREDPLGIGRPWTSQRSDKPKTE